jgi:hypothetical protein
MGCKSATDFVLTKLLAENIQYVQLTKVTAT